MFLSHGRRLFTGSQTALAECRRAWDRLRRKTQLQRAQNIRRNTLKEEHEIPLFS